jgi:hypothetical protein
MLVANQQPAHTEGPSHNVGQQQQQQQLLGVAANKAGTIPAAQQQAPLKEPSLPFEVLAQGAATLLAPGGHLSVILPTPAGEAAAFARLAQEAGLRLVGGEGGLAAMQPLTS